MTLTKRQTFYLQLIADGETVPSISRRKYRSIKTIETMLQRARKRLRARTTAHAVAAAMRQGLIE